MPNNLAKRAIFFLGYFSGKASSQGEYGLYGEDWREMVQEAAHATGFTPKWLIEHDRKEVEALAAEQAKAEIAVDEVPF